ncbi:hypothetical protein [Sphingobacterium sp. BIGb0165]|uniref:hypothetical protein n=1 Tax=Sphingobacterium sp. BIGb0165 TaxID=2940615 RepID=UPI002166C959|nr:hypothetical protein [Sphingobacterium sp. BIGb0165]MCS4228076.1 hypothetical protein [Sphingobacterium sp. BIGb0165]
MQKRFISSLRNKSLQLLLAGGILASSTTAFAQKTTSASPYSQLGIGQIREDLLPQYRAMGGISTAIRTLDGIYYNTNPSNPASYSAARLSVFDAGLYGNYTQLKSTTRSANTADFAFSHITMTFPMQKFGGISLGLLPFSDVGYRTNSQESINSQTFNKVFTGEGGLTKAYAGWGVRVYKGLSVGANMSYLFGTLNDYSRVEFPLSSGALNPQRQNKREIQGIIFDYGLQYEQPIGKEYALTFGYSGSLNNDIKERTTIFDTRTQPSSDPDNQNIPIDTTYMSERTSRHLTLPLKHNIGVTLARNGKWLVGADFKYADWSRFQVRNGEGELRKNYGVSVGGQLTPDRSSLNYLNHVDYRLGFRYNKTQYFLAGQDINDMAVTVGVGLPLARTQYSSAFSKINFSAEFGQMGKVANGLLRERYINFNIGFTLNDRWFRRNQFD